MTRARDTWVQEHLPPADDVGRLAEALFVRRPVEFASEVGIDREAEIGQECLRRGLVDGQVVALLHPGVQPEILVDCADRGGFRMGFGVDVQGQGDLERPGSRAFCSRNADLRRRDPSSSFISAPTRSQ